MLGDTNLSDLHEIEQLRRSIAMLPPSGDQLVFTRNEALKVLTALHQANEQLAQAVDTSGFPGPS